MTKELSEGAKKDFNRITRLDKEVIAVFYTHWHGDHWEGVKAWITEEDARSGKVDVTETFDKEFVNQKLWCN